MSSLRKNKKSLWLLGILIVLGLGVMGWRHFRTDPVDAVLVNPVEGETVITGTFSCLPLRSGEPITNDNCVMGLAADGPTDAQKGKMYALDSSQVSIMSRTIGVKDRVRVVGKVSVPNTSIDEGNAFKIDGVIQVRAVQHASEQ